MRKIRDGIEVKHFLPTGEVIVSFELSYDDWCLLRQSDNWNHIQNWIEELQNKGNQMSLKEKISLLEKEKAAPKSEQQFEKPETTLQALKTLSEEHLHLCEPLQLHIEISKRGKPKEQKNSDWFISERIINISELEEYIELSNVSVQLLKKEMKKNNPSTELVNELLDTISTNISKAKNFEFCIERRKTISKNYLITG